MRFFHVSDLHFGKQFYNMNLTETDQPFWVERFLEAVEQYQPDAVVIAGDVYDRKNPSAEAMHLFDKLITGLAQRKTYTFVIPGNHDAALRLSHGSTLLQSHHIYIAGDVSRELQHVTLGDVTFWMMPYIFPKAVASPSVLNREDINSYQEAARALIAEQPLDTSKCNVLVAHQNVLACGQAPEHSDSESIIGGLGEIDYTVFDPFDYVALGHIHNAQKVGRETVRYAGCPLYYDFSETHRRKDLTLVTIHAKDDIQIESIPIKLPHTLLQLTGTLDELKEQGLDLPDKDQYYIQCVVSNKNRPPHILDKLREVFGNSLVNVKIAREERFSAFQTVSQGTAASQRLDEQYMEFFHSIENDYPDSKQEELLQLIIEQQERFSGEYYTDDKNIPEKDSQELIDLLLDGWEDKK